MRVTTKSTAPKPSLEMAKTILAQVNLLTEKLERGPFSHDNGQSGTDLATMTLDSLTRNHGIATKLGVSTEAGLKDMRGGHSPAIPLAACRT